MSYLGYVILIAAIAVAVWTVRELVFRTFKDANRTRPFIVRFALAGLVIATVFIATTQLWNPQGPVPAWFGILILVLCPPALLEGIFLDVPHPSVAWLIGAWILTALMNSALYAAIGGRIGAQQLRRRLSASPTSRA